MTRSSLNIYFAWSLSALIGADPEQSDMYLRDNLLTIKSVAAELLNQSPCLQHINKPLFRGVIMEEGDLTQLPGLSAAGWDSEFRYWAANSLWLNPKMVKEIESYIRSKILNES